MYKKYRVVRKIKESSLVYSLYLEPADGSPTEPFLPGQHLMFKFQVPGNETVLFRYYSFSDVYHPGYYRVSVKMETAEHPQQGICSSYIFNYVKEGDILEAKSPQGSFILDTKEEHPVALFAGGIGITPLLCMIKSIASQGSARRVVLFYGVTDKHHHSFQQELHELQNKYPWLEIHTFYNATANDPSEEYYTGLIDLSYLHEDFKTPASRHYICGPAAMMEYITDSLLRTGILRSQILQESFVSALPDTEKEILVAATTSQPDKGIVIRYSKTGTALSWDSRYKSLLEFSEANDIEIDSGCLFGDCGTCLTRLFEGDIKYVHPTMIQPEKGTCLPCSCIPVTDIVLDA